MYVFCAFIGLYADGVLRLNVPVLVKSADHLPAFLAIQHKTCGVVVESFLVLR